MMQVIEQTREEKIKMYMKCTKREIIEMLLENQRLLSREDYFNKPLEVNDWPIKFVVT